MYMWDSVSLPADGGHILWRVISAKSTDMHIMLQTCTHAIDLHTQTCTNSIDMRLLYIYIYIYSTPPHLLYRHCTNQQTCTNSIDMREFNKQALTIMKDMYMGAHAPSTSRSAISAPLWRSQIVTGKIKGSPLPGPASLLHSWLPHANSCSVYMLMSIEFVQVYMCKSIAWVQVYGICTCLPQTSHEFTFTSVTFGTNHSSQGVSPLACLWKAISK